MDSHPHPPKCLQYLCQHRVRPGPKPHNVEVISGVRSAFLSVTSGGGAPWSDESDEALSRVRGSTGSIAHYLIRPQRLLGRARYCEPALRAASIAATSIFFIPIIASNARFASFPPCAMASVNTRGVICHERPHLSLHQPHALSWPPLLTMAFQ